MAKESINNGKSSKSKILVVDEQPLFRRGLAGLIKAQADMVVCGQAATRAAALQALETASPALVTMDLSLPAGDGLELLKDMRARFPDVMALVVSGQDESIYAERAIRAGARGFVSKHEPETTVLEAIRDVLTGGRFISRKMTSWFADQYLEGRAPKQGSLVGLLSDRELEVFRLLGQHIARREISRRLNLSVKTVESYRAKIKDKLGLASGAELAERASQWVSKTRDL